MTVVPWLAARQGGRRQGDAAGTPRVQIIDDLRIAASAANTATRVAIAAG